MSKSNKSVSAGAQGGLVVNGVAVKRRSEDERCGKCQQCGKGIQRSRRGRCRQFCSDKCRKAAKRAGNLRTVATNNKAVSGKSAGQNAIPVNLLGGHRFPGAPVMEPDVVATILHTEATLVRHEVVPLRPAKQVTVDDTPVRPSDWVPSSNCNPDDMPDIPPFLQRNPDNTLKYPGLLSADDSESEAAA
jgi:endogenous inhibitor of DNA gyrase (YacG/DUF329 family)